MSFYICPNNRHGKNNPCNTYGSMGKTKPGIHAFHYKREPFLRCEPVSVVFSFPFELGTWQLTLLKLERVLLKGSWICARE